MASVLFTRFRLIHNRIGSFSLGVAGGRGGFEQLSVREDSAFGVVSESACFPMTKAYERVFTLYMSCHQNTYWKLSMFLGAGFLPFSRKPAFLHGRYREGAMLFSLPEHCGRQMLIFSLGSNFCANIKINRNITTVSVFYQNTSVQCWQRTPCHRDCVCPAQLYMGQKNGIEFGHVFKPAHIPRQRSAPSV